MSEETAIELLEHTAYDDFNLYDHQIKGRLEAIQVLIKQYNQLKEDNKELEFIVGLRQKRNLIRRFDNEYDEEDKKKHPNRDYGGVIPDAEEVYKRYYKQKEVIEEVREFVDEMFNNEPANSREYDYYCEKLLQTLDKVKEND